MDDTCKYEEMFSPAEIDTHDRICQLRRKCGVCPQAPVIKSLEEKMEYLIKSKQLEIEEFSNRTGE